MVQLDSDGREINRGFYFDLKSKSVVYVRPTSSGLDISYSGRGWSGSERYDGRPVESAGNLLPIKNTRDIPELLRLAGIRSLAKPKKRLSLKRR